MKEGVIMNSSETSIKADSDVLFKIYNIEIEGFTQAIIQGTTNRQVQSLQYLNAEVLPKKDKKKKGYMDVYVQDEQLNYYDIEMQKGPLTEELILRVCYYCSYLFTMQSKTGEFLSSKIHHIHAILLMANGFNYDGLVRYDVMNNHGNILPGIRIHYYLVNIPYIKEISKIKGLHNLTTFERIIYALHTNIDSDILKIDERMVYKMNKILIDFLTNYSPETDYALKQMLYEKQLEATRIREQQEKEELENKIAQFQKDKDTLQKDKDILQKDKDTLQQEKEDAINNLIATYHLTYEEALQIFKKTN